MWPFNKKIPKMEELNVGKTTVQITFTDNSSELKEFEGYQPKSLHGLKLRPLIGLHMARQFMNDIPRRDYRVSIDSGNEMRFKDVHSVKIVKNEPHIIKRYV